MMGGGADLLHGIALDARHLLRTLRGSVTFAAFTILTVALGIGLTTTVVTIADHVLVRGLPFRDPGRLASLFERDELGALRLPSYPTTRDWRLDPGFRQAFEDVTFVRGDGVSLRVGEEVESSGAAFVSPEFFAIIGARPFLGRLPAPGEFQSGASPVAVISFRLWRRRFGGDPAVVGRAVSIDSIPTTVVGVLPPGSVYPTFAEVWMPIAQYRHQDILTRRGLHVDSRAIGRLRHGVDSTRAAALTRPAGIRLGAAYPAEQAGWLPAMFPLQEEIIGGVRPTLLALTAAAAAMLLLVCANIAGLLIARLTTRSRELAVRAALGASRARLVAQLLTESLLLSAVGGLLGTGLAAFLVSLARKLPPGRIPRAEDLVIDTRMLAIAAVTTMITALACGVWPAWRATSHRAIELLRASSAGSGGMRSDGALRRVLVTAQFAIALVLLVGSGLLLQSFRRAAGAELGLDPVGVITFRVQPPGGVYSTAPEAAALYERLMSATRAVPGVVEAAFINHAPFGSAAIPTFVSIAGRATLDSSSQVFYRTASATYLATMRMTLASGRWLDDTDMRSARASFVVNESMARRYWPGGRAVGQRLTVTRASQARSDFGQPIAGTVVGVVRDVRQASRDLPADAEVYVPYTLETWPWGTLVVRARNAATVVPALSAAVRSVDPRLVPAGATGLKAFARLETTVDASLGSRRLSTWVIVGFAGCALLLAALGLYGVVAQAVTQRTREIGVRRALGATDRSIAGLFLRESARIIVIGTAIGCAGAWAAGRLVRGLLFETTLADPVAYVGTVALLACVAITATWPPARRAMRIDPTLAMREE
jgi:putative ABC transport system permease protein